MKPSVRRIALTAALLVCGVPGCSERAPRNTPGAPAAPSVDVTADRARVRESWVLGVAKDAAALGTLAQSNAGWGKLFTSDPAGALAEFDAALKSGTPSDAIRTGAARAAIELATAHAAVADVVAVLTERLSRAKTDAGGAEGAAWRTWMLSRLAARTGQPLDVSGLAADGPLASLVAAVKPGATGPLAALLAGKVEGLDAPLPAGATAEYAARLSVAALISAGRIPEAVSRFERIPPNAPDVVVGPADGSVSLRDPALADLGARVYAARAIDALGAAPGWGTLHKARALLLLGRAAEAKAALEPLVAAPPADAPLAELVLTDALTAADLALEARALLARARHGAGDAASAKADVAALPTDTIGHRVLKTWASTGLGEALDGAAFPDDRALLARTVGAEIDALGAEAKGAADVAALNLVERYADAVERRFADAASISGAPEVALKHLENAEDKGAAFAPSPRNGVAALARAARENVRIGRPRVALKYFSRLAERFPAVAAAADMLRDVLTIRAMDQEGGAASGQ
jgi:tetratricopeptide (TPR) repeat protein